MTVSEHLLAKHCCGITCSSVSFSFLHSHKRFVGSMKMPWEVRGFTEKGELSLVVGPILMHVRPLVSSKEILITLVSLLKGEIEMNF